MTLNSALWILISAVIIASWVFESGRVDGYDVTISVLACIGIFNSTRS